MRTAGTPPSAAARGSSQAAAGPFSGGSDLRLAAVGEELDAVDVAGIVAGQEYGDLGDLAWVSDPRDRASLPAGGWTEAVDPMIVLNLQLP
jgi:hypothetical protein